MTRHFFASQEGTVRIVRWNGDGDHRQIGRGAENRSNFGWSQPAGAATEARRRPSNAARLMITIIFIIIIDIIEKNPLGAEGAPAFLCVDRRHNADCRSNRTAVNRLTPGLDSHADEEREGRNGGHYFPHAHGHGLHSGRAGGRGADGGDGQRGDSRRTTQVHRRGIIIIMVIIRRSRDGTGTGTGP